MSEPAFDELLRRLAAADCEFVVVGGLAVNAWGVVRGTKDVDIVVAPEPENLKRVAEVAVGANGHVQQGEALLGSPFSIAAALSSGEHEGLRLRASEAEILGVTVAVCSLADLKAMKEAAGRTRDLADLEDLESTDPPAY
ncbi:MAG TPA: hypothetical protein VF009_01385 [Solirubrobacterales bacterium]